MDYKKNLIDSIVQTKAMRSFVGVSKHKKQVHSKYK